jgi:putative endonuclease
MSHPSKELQVGKTRDLGRKGEDLALSFLKKRGYRLLERNFNTRWGEIDIVACKDSVLHMVEVRTVSRGGLLDPREALTKKKQEHLWRAVEIYLQRSGWQGDYAVDFLAIEWDEEDPRMEFFENALEGYWG